MKSRSPSVARAVLIQADSSSGVAEVYRSGSGDWSRNIVEPPRWVGVPIGGRCGQPGRPARGCRPRNGYVAGYLAGVRELYRISPTTRPYDEIPHGSASPDRHDPRHARLLSIQGRRRTGDLRRQGEVVAVAPVELL